MAPSFPGADFRNEELGTIREQESDALAAATPSGREAGGEGVAVALELRPDTVAPLKRSAGARGRVRTWSVR